MIVIGYLAAVLIGLSLGLIGGGGSILTVPVLVYLFHIEPLLATSYSLFVVGTTSLAGAYKNYKAHHVDIRTVFLFGLTSIITVLTVRRLLLPAIPEQLFSVADTVVTKSVLLMVLFGLLMVLASYFMIRGQRAPVPPSEKRSTLKLFLYGALVGLITGVLGAGGGFILIPALVMLVKLPMKTAIGTSLSIIALTALIGFAGDLGQHSFDWSLLLPVTGLALTGIFIGDKLGQSIEGYKLKKGFGWFVLSMGVFVLIMQLLPLFSM